MTKKSLALYERRAQGKTQAFEMATKRFSASLYWCYTGSGEKTQERQEKSNAGRM